MVAEVRWVAVVVRPLSTEAVVMVLLAGLVSGAVARFEADMEGVVEEEARSLHHRCMTACHCYSKRVAEACWCLWVRRMVVVVVVVVECLHSRAR
jgi:hypothetical protein